MSGSSWKFSISWGFPGKKCYTNILYSTICKILQNMLGLYYITYGEKCLEYASDILFQTFFSRSYVM